MPRRFDRTADNFTLPQAARVLGVSLRTLYRIDDLPIAYIARRTPRIPRAALEEWVRSRVHRASDARSSKR